MKLRVLRPLILLVILLLGSGCASIFREQESSRGDQLPWNTPANWEGQGIGLPY